MIRGRTLFSALLVAFVGSAQAADPFTITRCSQRAGGATYGCKQWETCNDKTQNQGETDVDCGGPNCPKCGIGKRCTNPEELNSAKEFSKEGQWDFAKYFHFYNVEHDDCAVGLRCIAVDKNQENWAWVQETASDAYASFNETYTSVSETVGIRRRRLLDEDSAPLAFTCQDFKFCEGRISYEKCDANSEKCDANGDWALEKDANDEWARKPTKETVNVWTSGTYCVASLVIFLRFWKNQHIWAATFAALLFMQGMGSAGHHYYRGMHPVWMLMDFIPMVLLMGLGCLVMWDSIFKHTIIDTLWECLLFPIGISLIIALMVGLICFADHPDVDYIFAAGVLSCHCCIFVLHKLLKGEWINVYRLVGCRHRILFYKNKLSSILPSSTAARRKSKFMTDMKVQDEARVKREDVHRTNSLAFRWLLLRSLVLWIGAVACRISEGMLCTPENAASMRWLHGLWHIVSAWAVHEFVVIVIYMHALNYGGEPILVNFGLYHMGLKAVRSERVCFKKRDQFRDRHQQVREFCAQWPHYGLPWFLRYVVPNLTTLVFAKNQHEIEQITNPDKHMKIKNRVVKNLLEESDKLDAEVRSGNIRNAELSSNITTLKSQLVEHAAANNEWADYAERKEAEHQRQIAEIEATLAQVLASYSSDRGDCQQLFNAYDVNGDGRLQFNEIEPMLMHAGFEQEELKYLFEKYDVNEDGEIDVEEFTHLFSVLKERVVASQMGALDAGVDASDAVKAARLRREHEQAKRDLEDRMHTHREEQQKKIRQRLEKRRPQQTAGGICKKVSLSAEDYKAFAWCEAYESAHGTEEEKAAAADNQQAAAALKQWAELGEH